MDTGAIFDGVVVAILLISAIIAFLRGFIREVLTIFGVVGGLCAAYFAGPVFSPITAGWLGYDAKADPPQEMFGFIPYPVAADALSYGGIFIIVVILLSIISHFLAGWAKTAGLGAIDRTFGVMFGIARGVVMVGLLYLPLYLTMGPEPRDDLFKSSRTKFYVESAASFMASIVPESMTANIEKKVNDKVAESTREKLQELEVLKGENAPVQKDESSDPESGYSDDVRQDMNELIEGNTNE